MPKNSHTKQVAHRGCSEGNRAAENVLSSYVKAYETLRAAECDIQRTKDEKLVLWHDHQLGDEATAKGGATFAATRLFQKQGQPIGNFSYEELRAAAPTMTLLSEVLRAIPESAELFIEIKLPVLFCKIVVSP